MGKIGKLFIISGPSGVGKGTVRREVFKHDELDLKYSVSMTTRKIRKGEKDGVDYFFVTKPQFKKAIANDELLEYAEFVGNFYGTPRHYVEKLTNEGHNVILEIEVEGAKQVIKKWKNPITIFLFPPTFEELEKRIRNRHTESEDILMERLNKAKKEMKMHNIYDYKVINDKVEAAAKEIVKIIKKHQK
jgi:guanylate kinase